MGRPEVGVYALAETMFARGHLAAFFLATVLSVVNPVGA
jgi:hypothetical protein